jgi:hypothetical protein
MPQLWPFRRFVAPAVKGEAVWWRAEVSCAGSREAAWGPGGQWPRGAGQWRSAGPRGCAGAGPRGRGGQWRGGVVASGAGAWWPVARGRGGQWRGGVVASGAGAWWA